MDKLFLLKVLISFLIAGSWIAAATLFAEKLGSKIGGLFTNLPSNILISLLFIAIVNDTSYVIHAVPSIPIGMTLNTLFLFMFVIFLRYGLIPATIISLSVWLVLAFVASFFSWKNLFVNVIFYILITLLGFMILEKTAKIPSIKNSRKKYTKLQMLIRALFAGSIVSTVIIISKFANPYIVGIFSTFPAVLLSTMIILAINQNNDFARATGKVLILSSSNIVLYGLAVYITYPKLGIISGTIVSFIFAFIWVCLFHPIVQRLT